MLGHVLETHSNRRSADYIISLGPLRSVRIFRALKMVLLEPSSKHCFSYLTTFMHVSLIKTNVNF